MKQPGTKPAVFCLFVKSNFYMLVPFESLSDQARVWIFPSSRVLTTDEIVYIKESGAKFVEQWTAHGKDLLGSISVRENRFILLAVDETQALASGCSIDKSVHFIQLLEKELQLSLTDRAQVQYVKDDEVEQVHFTQIKPLIESGDIQMTTPVYNNMVQTKRELELKWLQEAESTWLKKYFPTEASAS
jgi:hypothetical protein